MCENFYVCDSGAFLEDVKFLCFIQDISAAVIPPKLSISNDYRRCHPKALREVVIVR